MRELTVGSLFAGVGGIDMGLERAGMKTLWQVEWTVKCQEVLRHVWPQAEVFGDIRKVGGVPQEGDQSGGDDGRAAVLVPVDLICGGFPCQDYSVAGKRGGLAGDRGALWWEMRRIVADVRPTWVVGENVPGLLSSNDGRDFLTIVASLVQLGYGVTWAVLDSQYFGVAQRRRRLFIVGHSGGRPRPEVLALSEGLCWHPAPCRGTGEGAPRAAAPGAGEEGGEAGGEGAVGFAYNSGLGVPCHDEHTGTLQCGSMGQWAVDEAPGGPTLPAQKQTIAIDLGGGRGNAGFADDISPSLTAGFQGHGVLDDQEPMSTPDSPTGYQGDRFVDPRDIAHTLPAGGGNLGGGPAQILGAATPRRLTPRECERLQGFPDDHTRYGLRYPVMRKAGGGACLGARGSAHSVGRPRGGARTRLAGCAWTTTPSGSRSTTGRGTP